MSEPKLTWHHPLCEGECFACLIERTVKKEYGEVGLRYLLKHINVNPVEPLSLIDWESIDKEQLRRYEEKFGTIPVESVTQTKQNTAIIDRAKVIQEGFRQFWEFHGIDIECDAPVRTKDLTDDEIDKIHSLDKFWDAHADDIFRHMDFARAVIAADREKNK